MFSGSRAETEPDRGWPRLVLPLSQDPGAYARRWRAGGSVALAACGDVAIDAGCLQMIDVLGRAVSGVGEDSLWAATRVGLDRIDQGWKGAAVGRIGR